MTTHITCDAFADSLAGLLERELPEPTRVAMEAHAASCDDCGPLLADLRRLGTEAANLPELAPSRDLWAGIAARIQTPVVELNSASGEWATQRVGAPRFRGSRWTRRAGLGLAAAALVGITATVTHEITKRSVAASTLASRGEPARPVATGDTALTHTPANQSAASQPSAVVAASTPDSAAPTSGPGRPAVPKGSLVSNHAKPSAQETYDREIATLRAVLAYRRKDLDSGTVAVVDKNLQIIDDAIAQCQAALKKDPQSRFLLESLNDALDNKVQLLRTAASLPSGS